MAKVPYQGYSEIAPSTANVNVATPPEAFGVGTARAVEGLGESIDRAGDKLYTRALAFQQLNNETEAEAANVKFMGSAGELHADYNSKQGKERVDAFPAYKDNLTKLQADIRGSLSNDMARRMFDRQSNSTLSHSIFNGAGAAATAAKDYAKTTAVAQLDMSVKTISDDPTNDILFAQKKADIINASNKVAFFEHGAAPGSDIANDVAMKNVSIAKRQQIISVSRVDPFLADEMLDQAVKTKSITGPDAEIATRTVRSEARSISTANIGREVYEAGRETPDKPADTLKVMEDKARDLYEQRHPNDPVGKEHAAQAVSAIYGRDKYATRQEELTNIQAVDNAIVSSGVKTPQELRALSPKMATTVDALSDKEQLALPGKINRYNAARNKITSRDNWVQLEGMRVGNPIKFLDQDVTKWELDTNDMKYFIKQQEKLKDNPQANPQVQQAVGWMRTNTKLAGLMRAAGVYTAPTKAEGSAAGEDWDRFMGTLSGAIEAEIKATGKPPKYKEITETIGPQVLKGISEPYFFNLLSSEVPYFKRTLNQEEYEAFKKERTQAAIDRGESAPSDAKLDRMYQTMDYKRFYGKAKE